MAKLGFGRATPIYSVTTFQQSCAKPVDCHNAHANQACHFARQKHLAALLLFARPPGVAANYNSNRKHESTMSPEDLTTKDMTTALHVIGKAGGASSKHAVPRAVEGMLDLPRDSLVAKTRSIHNLM